MKLSILISSTHTRYDNFLPKILNSLYSQLTESNRGLVEVLTFIDNKERSVGAKRNNLVEMAKGEYITFIDDDDRVSADYVQTLLDAIIDQDVICFNVEVSLNGSVPKICYYSKNFRMDYNTPDAYYRLPNHLMCYRRELASSIKYLDIRCGEDSDFAKRMLPLINTELIIDKVLYYYDFNSSTTETQN
jgi:glycosyltransferase involved in cell wall biosynthesis